MDVVNHLKLIFLSKNVNIVTKCDYKYIFLFKNKKYYV